MVDAPIRDFGIYGKTLPEFDPGFLHFERLEQQLPFHDWVAAPHRHETLDQFFLVSHGRGTLVAETERHDFDAPVLIYMPAGTVHGFEGFARDVAAPIITVARTFMETALAGLDTRLLQALRRPQLIYLRSMPREAEDLQAAFGVIGREYVGEGIGRQDVMIASLRLILIAMGRMAVTPSPEGRPAQVALFSDFLALMERDFRLQPKVATMAQQLGTSVGTLNAACQALGGGSPQHLLHERLTTEAKRMLLYTTHPASTLSYMLGFRDPAYFSRFFRRAVGVPPGEFRARLRRPEGNDPPRQ